MNEYKRYTWREYRRNHTDADCGGYSEAAYIYELDKSGTTIVIAADESEILYRDEAWGFTMYIPDGTGYIMICSPCYTSPDAANEFSSITLSVIAAEGFEHVDEYVKDLYIERI